MSREWMRYLRTITPGEVARWVSVLAYAALVIIVLSFLAAFLWGSV